MIKAIIFDFDGVLVESADIKSAAFRNLFSKWPDKVEEIMDFHVRNMGISRYVKFKHFFENILKEPYSEQIGNELSDQFSSLVVNEVKHAAFVEGALEFLQHDRGHMLFIASGTPHEELLDIVTEKGIQGYFKGIYGSPTSKTDAIRAILRTHRLVKNEVVFIGDAVSDYLAASECGVWFLLRIGQGASVIPGTTTIQNLTELSSAVEKIR